MTCEVESAKYTQEKAMVSNSIADETIKKERSLQELFLVIQMDSEDELRQLLDGNDLLNSKIDYKPLKQIDSENGSSNVILSNWTALHECIRQNNTRMLQVLIDNGADIEIKDGCGRTPVYYSCSISSADPLKILLRAGANPNPLGMDGWSALMKATQEHRCEHVEVLCENGANIMIGLDSFGRNALDIAALLSTGQMRVYKEGNETVQEAIAQYKKVHAVISNHVSKTMPWLLWE